MTSAVALDNLIMKSPERNNNNIEVEQYAIRNR